MHSSLDEIENAIWNETAAHRQGVCVTVPVLMATVQAHRLNQMEVLPGAGHRHVQKPALLLDLFAVANRHV